MRVSVNDGCIGCGMCATSCPDVFAIGDDGLAHALDGEVPEKLAEDVAAAADDCPITAIEIG